MAQILNAISLGKPVGLDVFTTGGRGPWISTRDVKFVPNLVKDSLNSSIQSLEKSALSITPPGKTYILGFRWRTRKNEFREAQIQLIVDTTETKISTSHRGYGGYTLYKLTINALLAALSSNKTLQSKALLSWLFLAAKINVAEFRIKGLAALILFVRSSNRHLLLRPLRRTYWICWPGY